MSALHLESPEEQEAFHFYQHHSAIELSGFFDCGFWRHDVLHACHKIPAIRHSLIALAAMHKKFISGRLPVVPDDASDKQMRFALQQSNRAIQEIIKSPMQRTIADRISMMACCVLFNNLACIQGHQNMAMEHLRSGLRILREIDEELAIGTEDLTGHPVSLATLRAMFVNMDVQARGIMSDDALFKWEPQPRRDFAVRRTTFRTFIQARFYFEATFNDVLAFIQELDIRPPRTEEGIQRALQEYRRLRNQFDAGSVLLQNFLADPSIMANRQDNGAVAAIRLLHDQVRLILKAFSRFHTDTGGRVKAEEIDWSFEAEELKAILELAGQLLNTSTDLTLPPDKRPEDYYWTPGEPRNTLECTTPSLSRPVFSAGSGLLTALWLVTSRARDPVVRRTAIAMLVDFPRREGVWDSVLAGRIAWEAMLLEEAYSESDPDAIRGDVQPSQQQGFPHIFERHKIRDIALEYTGLRVATVEFRTVQQYEAGERGVFRHISW